MSYVSSGNYRKDCERTLRSGHINGQDVTVSELTGILNNIAKAIEPLDALKKRLFYKSDATEAIWNSINANLSESGESVDLVHALIGMITETGEIAEALINGLARQKKMDYVNLNEEIGDQMYYQAIALDRIGSSFDNAAITNNLKLRKRYGDKFSETAAEVRDLNEERQVLEANTLTNGQYEYSYVPEKSVPHTGKLSFDGNLYGVVYANVNTVTEL